MWNWLIDLFPVAQLDLYASRFGLAAILFSIFGGLCGWIALDVRNRSSVIKTTTEQERVVRLKTAEDHLSQAQDEVAALKRTQEPWTLSDKQAKELRIALTKAKKGRVVVEYIRSDERRSRPCAEQIRDILKESNYDVWGYMAGFMQADSAPLVGLQLNVKAGNSESVAAGLKNAFEVIGFQVRIGRRHPQDATHDDDQVVIWVGSKP